MKKINKKIKYKALIKQKFLYRLRHPFYKFGKGGQTMPTAIQDAIKGIWMEWQEKTLNIQVHTFNHLEDIKKGG